MQCAWLPSGQRISIHALREEGDLIAGGSNFPVKKFLSTPSARRATSSAGPQCLQG